MIQIVLIIVAVLAVIIAGYLLIAKPKIDNTIDAKIAAALAAAGVKTVGA